MISSFDINKYDYDNDYFVRSGKPESDLTQLRERLDMPYFETYIAYTNKDDRLCNRLNLPFIGVALTDDGHEVQIFVSVERWEAVKRAAVAEYMREQEGEKAELEEVANLLLDEYVEQHNVATAGAKGSW